MPTQKTPTDLVYFYLESEDTKLHTFISKSSPEFKRIKKELKNFYCVETMEEKKPVAFPQFYVKWRCDYDWSKENYSSLISQTPIENLGSKETIFLTFRYSEENWPAWCLISNKSPFLSTLKKELTDPEFHKIPMFPEMISEDMKSGKSKIITYSDFHKKNIQPELDRELKEKERKKKIGIKCAKIFNSNRKSNYIALLINYYKAYGLEDTSPKIRLEILIKDAQYFGGVKKYLKELQKIILKKNESILNN